MELKFGYADIGLSGVGSFNCTFMELKYSEFGENMRQFFVLIVPLWN